MRKRELIWIVVLLLVGWAYVHYFTNWGAKKEIVVIPSLRPPMNRGGNASVFPVYFTLDDFYHLTSVKVTEVETNPSIPAGHTLWHLVASEGSDGMKLFTYGQQIPGMEPDLKGARPEPLQTNATYRLELTAGKIKGGTDFHTKPIPK
jgi:hypothetical protein